MGVGASYPFPQTGEGPVTYHATIHIIFNNKNQNIQQQNLSLKTSAVNCSAELQTKVIHIHNTTDVLTMYPHCSFPFKKADPDTKETSLS